MLYHSLVYRYLERHHYCRHHCSSYYRQRKLKVEIFHPPPAGAAIDPPWLLGRPRMMSSMILLGRYSQLWPCFLARGEEALEEEE